MEKKKKDKKGDLNLKGRWLVAPQQVGSSNPPPSPAHSRVLDWTRAVAPPDLEARADHDTSPVHVHPNHRTKLLARRRQRSRLSGILHPIRDHVGISQHTPPFRPCPLLNNAFALFRTRPVHRSPRRRGKVKRIRECCRSRSAAADGQF
ncbi:uncharacterized protein J3R85_014506 [Psidium guajava]|nr:uncharacterized protein J3R85_014506 [Psidium guajava]